ncbi:MAG: hypothetical protein AAFX05_00650 [Planctomycetota bacterium]
MIASVTIMGGATERVMNAIVGDADRLESWMATARRAMRRHADCDANTHVLQSPREAAAMEVADALRALVKIDGVEADQVDWDVVANDLIDRLPVEVNPIVVAIDRAGRALQSLAAWMQPSSVNGAVARSA